MNRVFAITLMLCGCDGAAPAIDAGMDAGMDPGTVSCNNDRLYICEQYEISPARIADLEASCATTEGEWAEDECPSGSFGGCLETSGDGELITFHYPEGDFFSNAEVQASCEDNGQTYVAP
jgi:hypothetical protein